VIDLLFLVGLGLYLDLIPLRSLVALARCDKIIIDAYTSGPKYVVEELLKILKSTGKDVVLAQRFMLEGEGIESIVWESQDKDVCVAVVGDPMIATTHNALAVEAAASGIRAVVVPAPSIQCCAIGALGLLSYKMGKSVTVVSPKNGVVYEYPYEVIKSNLERGLHTLLLLEMDLERGYIMTPCEALKILFSIEQKRNEGVLEEQTRVVILSSIGTPSHRVCVRTLGELLQKCDNCGDPPYSIVILSKKLHPLEEEALKYAERGLLNMVPIEGSREVLEQVANILFR